MVTAGIRKHLLREAAGSPDFAWAFISRFLFLMAYALLTTYEAYYLLQKIGSAVADVPQQIFLGTLVQSIIIVAASLIGGHLSDRIGRRKIFVFTAAIAYGLALFVIAIATNFNGFLVGMAISGLGFGVYAAVDLALVADVLPNPVRRQGPRRVQHRGRAAVLHRAGARARHPRNRRRELRRAVCGCRCVRDRRRHRRPAREALSDERSGAHRAYGNTAGPWEGGRVAVPRARRRRPRSASGALAALHCSGDRGGPEPFATRRHGQARTPTQPPGGKPIASTVIWWSVRNRVQ